MAERVYIETSFVGYLTSQPSRDLVVAAHQQITHEWWDTRRASHELCVSQLVIQEASAGDPQAAQERIEAMQAMTLVETSPAALSLAKDLVQAGALPKKAGGDALHIAVAATQGIPYLLTWNCRHMANATMRPVIESVCARNGFKAPIICTPEELMGTKS
jgi:predicted nucleic acid-binding protein